MDFITLAWGEDYVKAAYNLLLSARRFSIPLTTTEITGEPLCAQEAKRFKPILIKQRLRRGPVCWLDADAYIHKVPKLIADDFGADLALFSPKDGEYYSGTLVVSPTDKSKAIMNDWEIELAKEGWDLDQQVLSEIIKVHKPEIMPLPFSYSWVKEMSSPSLGNPVIEHYRIGFKRANILYG